MKRNLSYFGLLTFLLLAAAGMQYLTRASELERTPPRATFSEFPAQIAEWRSTEEQTLTPGAVRELGADEYLSRTYLDERNAPLFLFIAWYAGQRQRKTFHSPQNCLPGAGWTLGEHRRHALSGGAINEYLIEKDGARMLALYWYHGRGRVVADEYWGRLYTLNDALRRGRTDGALVRVILLLPPTAPEQVAATLDQTRQAGLEFVRRLLPLLPHFIPD